MQSATAFPQPAAPYGPVDLIDADLVYVAAFTTTGRLVVIAHQGRSDGPYWTVPAGRRRHLHTDPAAVARRVLAVLGLQHTGVQALLAGRPRDLLPSLYTAAVLWDDQRPRFDTMVRALHTVPAAGNDLVGVDLRPPMVRTLLLERELFGTPPGDLAGQPSLYLVPRVTA